MNEKKTIKEKEALEGGTEMEEKQAKVRDSLNQEKHHRRTNFHELSYHAEGTPRSTKSVTILLRMHY
jgi:hypothetical protein